MFAIQAILWCLQALGSFILLVMGAFLLGGLIYAVRVSYLFFEYLLLTYIEGE